MSKDRISRRRHRLERRALWRRRGHEAIAAVFARWGIEGLPRTLIDRLAAAGRKRIFPARIEHRPTAELARAIEERLRRPFEGGVSPADYFELVTPALASLRGLAGLPRKAIEAIREALARHEDYKAESLRRANAVAVEHLRLDRAVFLVDTDEKRFSIRTLVPRERTFVIDEVPRRVWHVVDWAGGPVYVQAHALRRLKERVPLDTGHGQMCLLASLARASIVERRGDGLIVDLRVGEDKVGYACVLELAGAYLVRTVKLLGMAGTPEGERVRRILTREQISRLGVDTVEAFATGALDALRPVLERFGFGSMYAFGEKLERRPA